METIQIQPSLTYDKIEIQHIGQGRNILQIIKREGNTVPFDEGKIANAVAKAMMETKEGINETDLQAIVGLVCDKAVDLSDVTVENIQDIVEDTLVKSGKTDVAKRYILYREKRAKEREKGWQLNEMQKAIWEKKYEYEKEGFNGFIARVSGGDNAIGSRIRKRQFSFGGRILANRGLAKHGLKVTYSNCYVLPEPEDNIESIWETARDMARTYSYGGGVGISIGKLRPRNSRVHNNARTTSGAVSFMPLYSLTTETIGQNGRRGALMLSVPSSHPDLEEFIDVKTQQGAVTGANISIMIDDKFMQAVKAGREGKDTSQYRLHFTVEDTGEVIERYVDALKMYEKIIQNNVDWAEPGALYWDRINNWHLMSAHPDFRFAGTNPCAEEPLPPGGSCLLGSINLSEFVVSPFTERASFDFPKYVEAVHDAVWALNDVLDEGLDLHPLEVQKKTVGELRQIGLGVMGIADMLVKLGITYGSTKSLALSEVLAHILINEATSASADIAKEKGSFGWYEWEHINNSAFFQENIMPEIKEKVKQYGLRNSQLLCIAPTGSLSSMLGISGGIEPFFSLSYNRTTKSLHGTDVTYRVEEPIVQAYREATGNQGELPEYFVTAQTLNWRNRIEMQAVWQKYIDASISSTVNMPRGTTVEEAMDLYIYAWEMGLKGATIFVDGCKRQGILTLDAGNADGNEQETEQTTKPTGYFAECPECNSAGRGKGEMVMMEGCATCKECGFSPC
jgi:ribonucleoside-diphosphate reductase alpha chain